MTVQPYGICIFGYANPKRVLKLPQVAAIFALMICPSLASDTASSSGTIILVQFQEGRVLVAADSRGKGEGIAPNDRDRECKITPLGDKALFVMTGKTKAWDLTDHSKIVVDGHAAAKHAYEQLRRAPNTSTHIKDIADRWANEMVSEFSRWSVLDQSDFIKGVSEGNLASAVFVGATGDGTLVAYVVFIQYCFSPNNAPMPNTSLVPHVKSYVIPWRYSPNFTAWIGGARDKEGIVEFIQGKSERAIAANNRLKQAISSTPNADADALTVQFEIQSALDWAIHKDVVGGPVDILELKKGGSIHWITVKPPCQKQ